MITCSLLKLLSPFFVQAYQEKEKTLSHLLERDGSGASAKASCSQLLQAREHFFFSQFKRWLESWKDGNDLFYTFQPLSITANITLKWVQFIVLGQRDKSAIIFRYGGITVFVFVSRSDVMPPECGLNCSHTMILLSLSRFPVELITNQKSLDTEASNKLVVFRKTSKENDLCQFT